MMKKQQIIAIIDSGISEKVYFFDKIIGGVSFFIKENSIFMSDNFNDECGHGTKCASIIQKYSPQAKLFIIKIIDYTEMCESVLLLQALEFLLDKDVDIINISLSVNSDIYKKEIHDVMERLYKQGKIINVSVRNGFETSFPANDQFCFGVKGYLSNNMGYSFDENKEIQILGNIIPEWVCGINERWEWFGGNSKTTAFISSIIANILEKVENTSIESIIKELKKNQFYTKNKNLLTNNKNDEFKIKKMFENTKEILKKYIEEDNINIDTIIWQGRQFKIEDTYNLLKELENKLNINIEMNSITIYDFVNVRNLMTFLYKKTI